MAEGRRFWIWIWCCGSGEEGAEGGGGSRSGEVRADNRSGVFKWI